MEREKDIKNHDGHVNVKYEVSEGQKHCEFCLVWGFPCIVMLIISLMTAVKAGFVFSESHILELCVFLISFTLQLMLYYIMFQELPVMLYCLYWLAKGKLQRGQQSTLQRGHQSTSQREYQGNLQIERSVTEYIAAEEQTASDDNTTDEDIAFIKDNAITKEKEVSKAGEEEHQNTDTRKQTSSLQSSLPTQIENFCSPHADDGYQAELDAEKAKVTGAIIEYVHYIMSSFVAEEDMAALCHEIKNWAEDPDYLPQSVALKADLSTVELRHFVWNIGERLGRQNGYDGNAKARFAKALFLTEFAGVETDTIKNFTVAADRGQDKD